MKGLRGMRFLAELREILRPKKRTATKPPYHPQQHASALHAVDEIAKCSPAVLDLLFLQAILIEEVVAKEWRVAQQPCQAHTLDKCGAVPPAL